MVFECSAIVLVLLITSALTMVSGKKTVWGVGLLPLTLVPAGHIAGSFLKNMLSSALGLTPATAWLAIDILVLTITCMLLGIISLKLKKNRHRLTYLIICGLFCLILTCVLIVRTIVF